VGTKEEEVEKGATHILPDEGRSIWVLGGLVTYKIAAK
jgi:hypothetical protein